MSKPVNPRLMQKLKALKRMKAEGQFIPKNQAMQALDSEIAALQTHIHDGPAPGALADPAFLQAHNRYTHYVLKRLDRLAADKEAAEPALEAAKTQLRRTIVSQSLPDKA